ncbi:MAG: hypothetical protein ABUR63_08730, partial [Verrucomicrobiota bacterium]
MKLDSWYLDNLVCPRHRLSLRWDDPRLVCAQGDSYAVVDGVPVLLVDDVAQTHEAAAKSLNRGNGGNGDISALDQPQGLHPFVQQNLLATHGLMYRSVKLTEYPIPQIRL